MNLDRFSTPLAHEKLSHTKEFDLMFREDIQEEVITCCGCNFEIDETEEFVESSLYDEEYIHNLDECLNAYYTKENAKDLLCESKSLDKVI